MVAAVTSKQRMAIGYLVRAREEDPSTDDGVIYGGATFYDPEIAVAYVNFQTAEALARRGIVRYGHWDESGQALVLQPKEQG